jgi:riboflavin-specific deaminase-like protein
LQRAREELEYAHAVRLLPAPQAEVPIASVYAKELPLRPSGMLPYTVVNMVASVDGKAATNGKASNLGSAADRVVMDGLRAEVDAVLVGAGTLRAEKMTLGVSSYAQQRRVANGLPPQPLAVVVAGAPESVPALMQNLVNTGTHNTLVLVPKGHGYPGSLTQWTDAGATVVCVPGERGGGVDLGEALRMLREEHGVSRLLVEGGPSINGALISAGFVNELFVTLSPKMVGDASDPADAPPPSIVTGLVFPPDRPGPLDLRLRSVHAYEGELFLRYATSEATELAYS